MLKYIRAKNFYSISPNEELIMDFDTNFTVILGANASGKSNILKLIDILFNLMSAEPSSRKKLSCFMNVVKLKTYDFPDMFGILEIEAKFKIKCNEYEYFCKYEHHLYGGEFIQEYLKCDNEYIFSRNKDNVECKHNEFKSFEKELLKYNKSASLVLALYNKSDSEIIKNLFYFVQTPISNVNNESFKSLFYEYALGLSKALSSSDKKEYILNRVNKKLSNLDLHIDSVKVDYYGDKILEINFYHSDLKTELTYHFESSGTLNIFILLLLIERMYINSGILILDEIEKDIHPMLLRKIIYEFIKEGKGQIICSTHSLEILKALNDRRSVYFTEKNSKGETICYSLADFEEDENLTDDFYSDYIHGVLGALPKIEVEDE